MLVSSAVNLPRLKSRRARSRTCMAEPKYIYPQCSCKGIASLLSDHLTNKIAAIGFKTHCNTFLHTSSIPVTSMVSLLESWDDGKGCM